MRAAYPTLDANDTCYDHRHDFDPAPLSWTVTEPELTREAGLELTLDVNGVEYVVQENDSGGHVVAHPVSRVTWDRWMDEAES